jgi:virginiamycin B lyase
MNTRYIILIFAVVSGFVVSYTRNSPPIKAIAERAVATLKIPGYADFLVADGDAVWVTNRGRIEKLDRGHAQPVATVSVPKPCGTMAIGFGAVWVANCRETSIYRIDRQTARVSAIIPTTLADPTGELSVDVGAGSVWVLTESKGVLSRINPETNQVVARIEVAPHSYAVVFGFDAVWITNTGAAKTNEAGSVQRIDPRTNKVVATIPVGTTPRFLAAGEGGIWTLNQGDGSVSRIDPMTNRVVATIPVGVEGPGGDITTGAGRVWVRATKVLLSVIDPKTNQVTERFGPPAGSGAVRVANGFAWVSAHDIQTLWVLRP